MAATTKQQALQVLEQHEMDVERIRLLLARSPNQQMTLVDSVDAEEWEFTLRRRCHLFLMAKNKYMTRFEVIDSTSK